MAPFMREFVRCSRWWDVIVAVFLFVVFCPPQCTASAWIAASRPEVNGFVHTGLGTVNSGMVGEP